MSKSKGGKQMQKQNSTGVLQNHRHVVMVTKKEKEDDNPLYSTNS